MEILICQQKYRIEGMEDVTFDAVTAEVCMIGLSCV